MTSQMGEPRQAGDGVLKSAVTTDLPDSTSTLRQEDRVLRLLIERDTVCGHHDFYGAEFMPRYGSSIHRLRRKGFVISKEQCEDRDHNHQTIAWTFRLIAVPFQPPERKCEICGGGVTVQGTHVSWCPARNLLPDQLPGI